jgi:hypothetical protein
MAKGPEARLTRKILTQLRKEFGGYWVKIHGGPFQRIGLPDIIGCVQGKFVGFEVKVPQRKDNVSDLQQANIDAIEAAGGTSAVITSYEDAAEILRRKLS